MRRRAGFTLMEALTAVVVLGMLAAAVVPLMRRIGDAGLPDRLEADSLLRVLAERTAWTPGMTIPVPGRPDWTLRVAALEAGPEPAPATDHAPPAAPAHRWLCVSVLGRDGGTLAETLVVQVKP